MSHIWLGRGFSTPSPSNITSSICVKFKQTKHYCLIVAHTACTSPRSHSLFLLLLYLGGLDTTNLGLDVLPARRRKRVSLESGLGAGLAAGLRDVRVLVEPLHVEDALQVGPPVAIFLQKRRANVLGGLTDALPRVEREIGRVLDRLPRDLLVVLVVERQNAREQEIGDDAQRPVVDLLTVGLLEEHLRCYVRQRTKGIQAGLIWSNNLGETEINNFEVRSI